MLRASRYNAFAAVLLAAIAAGPLGAAPFFSRLGTREGLPNAAVTAIAQDRQGFLWFGTEGGLARYDGDSFKVFSHDPFDPGSLPDDRVRAILVDGDHLWAGTEGGLARLDLATETFVNYAISDSVVSTLAVDTRGLWVGKRAGLDLLDASGRIKSFVHDPADPGSLPAGPVRAMKADREGRLWVGCGGGLAVYEADMGRFRAVRSESSVRGRSSSDVTALDLDGAGALWIGGWGGISRYDPSTGIFEDFSIADARVCSVLAADEGRVYVGTWGGGLIEKLADGSFARFRASASPGTLPGDIVTSLAKDASGDVWIGTNGGGACVVSPTLGYDIIPAGNDSFPPGKVTSVLVDRYDCLWVLVYNEGVARRDRDGWRRFALPPRAGPASERPQPDDSVGFLREDARGVVWAGGDWGFARYDRSSDGFVLVSGAASAMADDPKGGAWIAGVGSDGRASLGLLTENGRAAGLKPVPYSGDLLRALCFDASGRLWAGGNDGLELLRGDGGSIVYRSPVRTIFLDSRAVLWIGSAGSGLGRYEPETDAIVGYTTRDGLPSDDVRGILEDAAGRLWLATREGLSLYDRSGAGISRVHLRGPERSEELFSGARGPDGSLYFGAIDRVYRVDPDRFSFDARLPPLAFSSVSVVGSAPIGPLAASRLVRLDVPWRRNSITLRFAALDYRDPERYRYSYKLEGLDSEWSPAGAGHCASYAALPGGRYVFRVRASNGDGLWSVVGLALPLRVGYAPWANPWSWLALALLLAGGGYACAFFSARSSLRDARREADSLLAKLMDASVSLETASIVDPSTGLPSRRKAGEHLELAFARASLQRLDLAIVMVDIDQFKSFNDRYGKSAGDECLLAAGKALSGIVRRSSDFLARYGGEEFIFILEETSLEGAAATGEAARRAIEELGSVTVSVGCASMQPEAGQSPDDLLAAAEKALMSAKQKGRNRTST